MEIDRNTIEGFARRVRKNLTFMISAEGRQDDIHMITQLVTSLLGLIVFPYVHFKEMGSVQFKQKSLDALEEAGWPHWEFSIGASPDLDDLLRHLRNALSHRRVRFSSDSRQLDQVDVRFWDRPNRCASDNWSASIRASYLLDFVLRLSDLIDQGE